MESETTPEQLEIERLTKLNGQYAADLQEIRSIVLDVLNIMDLLNPEKNNINPKFMPADGSPGENPLPHVIAGLTDLGFEYQRSQNKFQPAARRAELEAEFKKKVSFIWRAQAVFNRYAADLGAQKIELQEAPMQKV